ncbi:hypothetical protein P154DRAFT_238632 [Amniculicola lignicola CBS 123094]|uniref:Uncharacterized protein n=1 Tax=Amniculicola lignicola CBS 123094 TaxID=1392246 RepID=A0A6A5WDP6_9PLEO|nr:hypothetical protein P154DRAFT_238632 [Amniculicola lignicola CBS 123094]
MRQRREWYVSASTARYCQDTGVQTVPSRNLRGIRRYGAISRAKRDVGQAGQCACNVKTLIEVVSKCTCAEATSGVAQRSVFLAMLSLRDLVTGALFRAILKRASTSSRRLFSCSRRPNHQGFDLLVIATVARSPRIRPLSLLSSSYSTIGRS